MSDNEPQGEKLTDEFRMLGKNLADAARSAWDNPERQKLQNEIERGLSEMRNSLVNEYEHWSESPTAQRLKEDVESLGSRVRSSETEAKIRGELLNALRQVNQELENLTSQWGKSERVDDTPSEHDSQTAAADEASNETEPAANDPQADEAASSTGEED